MVKGKLCLLFSAFLYGVLPILATLAYSGGVNGVTLTFLRSFVAVPILFLMIMFEKINMRITKKQLSAIIKLAVFGGAMPILLLYLSYNYIPTGVATTLHFIYPLIIVISSAFIYHEKLSKLTLCSVLFVTIGIFMFTDISVHVSKLGIVLALLSGVLYSFYVVYIDYSNLDRMDFRVLTFYVMLFMSGVVLLFGIFTDTVSFKMTSSAWIFSIIISIITTLGAMPLLQIGIRYEGATTAGILSTFEPITTMILGTIFLGEIIGVNQIFGAGLILMGVLVAQHPQKRKSNR